VMCHGRLDVGRNCWKSAKSVTIAQKIVRPAGSHCSSSFFLLNKLTCNVTEYSKSIFLFSPILFYQAIFPPLL
jgi:hypothetical protein